MVNMHHLGEIEFVFCHYMQKQHIYSCNEVAMLVGKLQYMFKCLVNAAILGTVELLQFFLFHWLL